MLCRKSVDRQDVRQPGELHVEPVSQILAHELGTCHGSEYQYSPSERYYTNYAACAGSVYLRNSNVQHALCMSSLPNACVAHMQRILHTGTCLQKARKRGLGVVKRFVLHVQNCHAHACTVFAGVSSPPPEEMSPNDHIQLTTSS